jgi:HEAT repeat protein
VPRKDPVREKLAHLADLAERAPPSLAGDLRPFLRDRVGLVVAAAARAAGEHELRDLAPLLEEAFGRLLEDPVKTDPGCRGKLATAEALRQLDAPAHDLYLKGLALRQLEPSYGPPIDTAAPLRVCCAAALFETRHPFALLEATALLADPEPNARAGVAAVLGGVGSEGAEAVLRLKVLAGDAEPEVVGACVQALLHASFARSLPFVLGAMRGAGEAVVEQALLALGESRDERALVPLCEHAGSDAPEVRAAALLGLALARLQAGDEFLLGLVERAPERRAQEALRALKPRLFDAAFADRVRALVAGRAGAASLLRAFEASLPRG